MREVESTHHNVSLECVDDVVAAPWLILGSNLLIASELCIVSSQETLKIY